MSDPYEAGPPEYQPDEEPSADDIGVLFAAAAYEMTTWEWIREQDEGITGIGWDNLGHDRDEDREGWDG